MAALPTLELRRAADAPVTPTAIVDLRVGRVGAATRAALRRSPGPVLLRGPRCAPVPCTGAAPLGDVIACLDGSARSAAVLPAACAAARGTSGRLKLVAVVASSDARLARTAGFDADLLEAGHLAGLASSLVGPELAVDWEVLHGDKPAVAIAAHARTSGAALIAFNSHGESTPLRTLLGQTVIRTVRRSSVPVLVTRTTLAPPKPVPALGRPRAPRALVAAAPRLRHHRHLGMWLVLLLVGAALATTVRVPVYSVSGDVRAVGAVVSEEGRVSFPPAQPLLFPVVASHHDTLAAAVRGWLDRDVDVRRRSEFAPDQAGAWRANLALMDQAKRHAHQVAMRALGLDPRRVSVTIASDHLGGPSAGLAFALAIVDLLTPGDLAGGKRVVVTGAIAGDGAVRPVGGIRQKTVAARHARADLVVVPCANLAAAQAVAGPVTVVCAATFADALRLVAAPSGRP